MKKKTLIYQVKIGQSRLYDWCTQSVEDYARRIGADYICQTQMLMCIKPDPFLSNRSRAAWEKHNGLVIFEKENAFAYLEQYDQVAIVDSDIYIRRGSPNIFDDLHPSVAFGGVVEREMPITPAYQAKIVNYSAMQYSTLHNPKAGLDFTPNKLGYEFFNMGLMVMNRSLLSYINGTPEQFIRQPDFKRFVDGLGAWKWSTDQTLLNYWLKRDKIPTQHMSWKWNGLYTANTRIAECHFVHFFLKDKLPNRGENVEQLLKSV